MPHFLLPLTSHGSVLAALAMHAAGTSRPSRFLTLSWVARCLTANTSGWHHSQVGGPTAGAPTLGLANNSTLQGNALHGVPVQVCTTDDVVWVSLTYSQSSMQTVCWLHSKLFRLWCDSLCACLQLLRLQ